MSDIHEMTGYREGRVIVWNCETCGRKVAVYEAGTVNSTIIVMEQGDGAVAHRGGKGGLTVGAVLVEELPDVPPAFAQWAEGADFSALE